MSKSAVEIASKIDLGWNLGNSLEVSSGETAWGNPLTTKETITVVRSLGFNAIRIPVHYTAHMSSKRPYKVDEKWLERVREVVDYGIHNDMYVIINVHHDFMDKAENLRPAQHVPAVTEKVSYLWEQIATWFRDYDEHLMFACNNEPATKTEEGMKVLKTYSQAFVNAVRETGGRNAYRTLVLQCPSTDINAADDLMEMPEDPTVKNRLMAEVHFYSPWDYCGLTQNRQFWGEKYHRETGYPNKNCTKETEETYVDAQFQKMKAKFVDNGIPVVLGEYGVVNRWPKSIFAVDQRGNKIPWLDVWGQCHDQFEQSRAYFLEYVTKSAKNHGCIPFYWDDGYNFRLIRRADPGKGIQSDVFKGVVGGVEMDMTSALRGLQKGAEEGKYPF